MTATQTLTVGSHTYQYYSVADISARVPRSVAIVAENLIRQGADPAQIEALRSWSPGSDLDQEIEFSPARVVMQDFTGVPCVVDLATLREAVSNLGGNPELVNPRVPTELVIDHSVVADDFGSGVSFTRNVDFEFSRNTERYEFLKWGQESFQNFHVVPPGTGIVHQVNIEHLARVVVVDGDLLHPDTCVGTDSHTTMVNGLGVLGWGVGGIEAEAAMLGQPISMTLPCVVGVELVGDLAAGVTSTDLVLLITQKLRHHGVVGKFVEFYGEAVESLALETRATISNMSPEYGSTACLFPIDSRTIDYLTMTGRDPHHCAVVEAYAKAQGFWGSKQVAYSENLVIDLGQACPSISGPKRPQDRIDLAGSQTAFRQALHDGGHTPTTVSTGAGQISSGVVAIASITSCTNTSNPSVMIAAGLLAHKAVERSLTVDPWVKTTLAPGSQVVTDYLDRAGLSEPLAALGFSLVGYGCVTCIGNSGPVTPEVKKAVDAGVVATAVLSGNRNFEGRISPDVRMNYLASPPLVVAYALAGTMDIDFASEPVGTDPTGQNVYLKDLWPTEAEIASVVSNCVDPTMFTARYSSVFTGSSRWQDMVSQESIHYPWKDSTYIRRAPYFDDMSHTPAELTNITDGRILLVLGDSVTTDHISPAGSIKEDSPAGAYLRERGVEVKDFNSFGSRRGNHEVMVRGTFANIRLRNKMVPGVEGGYTLDLTQADKPMVSIFEASQGYLEQKTPLVIFAGQEYGSGSSRDWAAKGTSLLGVRAVIAQSYERIHRSNLVGMGILPLQFLEGESAETWGITGTEVISIEGLTDHLERVVDVVVDGSRHLAILRVDTPTEERYLRHGGILPYQARVMAGLA